MTKVLVCKLSVKKGKLSDTESHYLVTQFHYLTGKEENAIQESTGVSQLVNDTDPTF